jgi:hypothetical protein
MNTHSPSKGKEHIKSSK